MAELMPLVIRTVSIIRYSPSKKRTSNYLYQDQISILQYHTSLQDSTSSSYRIFHARSYLPTGTVSFLSLSLLFFLLSFLNRVPSSLLLSLHKPTFQGLLSFHPLSQASTSFQSFYYILRQCNLRTILSFPAVFKCDRGGHNLYLSGRCAYFHLVIFIYIQSDAHI